MRLLRECVTGCRFHASDTPARNRLNAAVFGYSSPSLFDFDSLALRSVVVGGIASGIGLVADVWFLVFYSGADVVKFQVRPRSPPGARTVN